MFCINNLHFVTIYTQDWKHVSMSIIFQDYTVLIRYNAYRPINKAWICSTTYPYYQKGNIFYNFYNPSYAYAWERQNMPAQIRRIEEIFKLRQCCVTNSRLWCDIVYNWKFMSFQIQFGVADVKVKMTTMCHILYVRASITLQPEWRYYELIVWHIVVKIFNLNFCNSGVSNNSITYITRPDNSSFKVYKNHEPLNCANMVEFWLSWINDTVQLGSGRQLDQYAFITLNDSVPTSKNYLAVSTGFGASGYWIFHSGKYISSNWRWHLSCKNNWWYVRNLVQMSAFCVRAYMITASDPV